MDGFEHTTANALIMDNRIDVREELKGWKGEESIDLEVYIPDIWVGT